MVPGLFGRVRRRAGSFMSHEPLCPALPFESSPDPRQLAVTQKDWNLSVLGRVRNFYILSILYEPLPLYIQMSTVL